MLKKTITYTDYNDRERTEDFYFNLDEAEIVEMQLGVAGGLDQSLQKLVAGMDQPNIIKFFKEFVLKCYGEKSADGREFIKNEEVRQRFVQTRAYSNLFMELAFDSSKAAEFINGVLPKDLAEKVAAEMTGENPTA